MEFISRRRIPNRRFHDPAGKAAQDTGPHQRAKGARSIATFPRRPVSGARCRATCKWGLNWEDADMTMPSGTETSRPPVPTTRDELLYRLRQQSLLGEFGRSALQTRDMKQILQRATELCSQGLDTPFAKVLEYMPDEKRLLIRAGVGCPSATIDHVALRSHVESPACYAFHTRKIVISTQLEEETICRTPRLPAHHGIRE